MRHEVLEYLQGQKDLKRFVREQPLWYRKLSRNPYDLQKLEIESLHYYKKTIPTKSRSFQIVFKWHK